LGVSTRNEFSLSETYLYHRPLCGTNFLVNFLFWRGKTKAGKPRIALGFTSYFPPRAGGGVWIFGFHNNKQIKEKSIGYPPSVFNKKLYSSTKCQTDTEKVMYPGMRVCTNASFTLCVCICVCRYVFVRVDKRARMCAVHVHTWI